MTVTPFAIGKHLSDLVGRRIEVKTDTLAKFSASTRSACYEMQPMRGTAVVKLDFALLTTLAGIMIGYPAAQIESQIRSEQLDENLADAASEVMNVLSSVIVDQGRAIFKGLFLSAGEYSGDALDALKESGFPLKLQVAPVGFKAGAMLIGVRS